MKYLLGFSILVAMASGLFLFLPNANPVEIFNSNNATSSASTTVSLATQKLNEDDPPQKPLENPPSVIKAIYATAWSAGSDDKVDYFIDLIKKTELNAIVIDIKDYSGYVLYDAKLPLVEKYEAKDVRIPKVNRLIKRLHDEGIYVVARITIFQDPVLAKARPDLAIHSRATGGLWLDNKKLAWIDPAAKEAWDYNISIAKDAAGRGFDEINFDYIRFASDGNLKDMVFPFYNASTTYKSGVIKDFFKYLRNELEGIKISADLFGLATVNKDDLGIGQLIESAYAYFDYVAPMVYPSHYAKGFLGFKSPAEYPYEVVKYSMDEAVKRLKNYELGITNNGTSTTGMASTTNQVPTSHILLPTSKLRPWLQDFNLGATYTAAMVKSEIQAVYDAASSTLELLDGFMLWNPSNVYTKGALSNE